jgi:hypothetical protein
MQNRHLAARRHAFGFDAIMAKPDYSRFQDWYARSSYFAPRRGELDAMLSQPEDWS